MYFHVILSRERNIKSREMKISSFLTLLMSLRYFIKTMTKVHSNDGKFLMFDDDDGAPFDIFIPYFLSPPLRFFVSLSLLLCTTVLSMFACFNLL